jgi:hypothetical protein
MLNTPLRQSGQHTEIIRTADLSTALRSGRDDKFVKQLATTRCARSKKHFHERALRFGRDDKFVALLYLVPGGSEARNSNSERVLSGVTVIGSSRWMTSFSLS